MLNTTAPTVLALIKSGKVKATEEPWGTRFRWRVDEDSLRRFVADHGIYPDRREPVASRLAAIEARLSALSREVRTIVEASGSRPAVEPGERVDRERDDLRTRNVSLEETLVRMRTAAELQRRADEERSSVTHHLLDALAAAERANGHRRRAAAELDEALAGFVRPGDISELS